MQGAGKTTVSALLAGRFERGAHIPADTMHRLIVEGGQWPEAREMSIEAAAQLRLRLANACLVAKAFVAAGFAAVVDDVIIGWRVEHLLKDLSGQRFYFVMLAPSLEAVKEREAGRGTRLWEEWGWMVEEIQTATPRIGLWLDTSAQTAEETVEEIVARYREEAVVEG